MPRTYKVEKPEGDKMYHGFEQGADKVPAEGYLAVAHTTDGTEPWTLDNVGPAVEELIRYHKDQGVKDVRISVYKMIQSHNA
jgi:hypothetical protein